MVTIWAHVACFEKQNKIDLNWNLVVIKPYLKPKKSNVFNNHLLFFSETKILIKIGKILKQMIWFVLPQRCENNLKILF